MIEYIEFEEGAKALAERCSGSGGSQSWEWLDFAKDCLEGSGCLAVKHVICLDMVNPENGEEMESQLEEWDEAEDPDGMKALSTAVESHFYDFHVIYSHSYRVPVLWFKGLTPDGTPLDLLRILEDFPKLKLAVEQMSGDQAAVSANEHPLLHIPWYFVHPCQTPSFMKLLLQEASLPPRQSSTLESTSGRRGEEALKGFSFLLSWFSVVLPLFGLPLPNLE